MRTYDLTTKIVIGDVERSVQANVIPQNNNHYKIGIVVENEGSELGIMICKLNEAGYENFLCRLDTDREHPRHILIINMENQSEYKHVGTALHEAAFRLSIEKEAQGHVRLDAARNTHYFHYLNGLRLEITPCTESDEHPATAYYKKLAKALKKAPTILRE